MNSQILYQRWKWWRPLENIKISSTLLELALKEVRCQDMMNQNLLFEREESTRPALTPTLQTHKKKEKKRRLFGHIIIILILFQGIGWVWKKEPWADTNLPQDFAQHHFSQSLNNTKDWWHNFSEPFDLTPVAVISNDVASGRADKSKNSLLFCRNKEFAIFLFLPGIFLYTSSNCFSFANLYCKKDSQYGASAVYHKLLINWVWSYSGHKQVHSM